MESKRIRCQNPIMESSRILLGAHRGDRKHYPENTMEAMRAAVEIGCDAIETDIRRTKDGHLVIIHDRDVLRTTNGQGYVDEMTLAQLRALDAGFWKGEAFRGAKIPTVEEFLDYVSTTDLIINWELKEYPAELGTERAFETADLLVEMIERYGMTERSVMNSFSEQVLEHIAYTWPGRFMIHGYIHHKNPKDLASRSLTDFLDWAAIWNKTPENPAGFADDYNYAIDNGIQTCILVPDTEDLYRSAIGMGCRMFTSDDPAEAVRVLRNLGYR